MKCCISLALALCLLSVAAFADGKDKSKLYEKKGDIERIYNLPYETMWKACMKAVAEDNVVEYSDKDTGVISFKTGMSMSSWGFKISISLNKQEENRTRIKLSTQKTRGQLVAWGAGGRTVDKFFKNLDKQLAEMGAAK